ncbi:SCO1860 family LAETG-anchored protein [Streptomyces sp. 549]|uniref:SCO1860 family LAETG-anchored protein n=1 Tax=Streptomyces sp. 549 TaxID=3049076 RepID=UPI0024C32E25|nr:SCO1860 family LAETG-anchored protein [Streptomyces sp. 549]MDK1474235.1 SCO1860 family LAETG-anchored protein [Streptomyces sp. 549]
MYSTVRRPALSLLAAAALVGVAGVPAHATGDADPGEARASVLRTGLDVGLLNKTVDVPLSVTLNEVSAPGQSGGSAENTALTAELDGVNRGKPFSVLRADVATARADVQDKKAEAEVVLARARVHVPGLPLLSVIEVEKVTSKAVCAAGAQPTAESNVLGSVSVLGKKVKLTAGGPTVVEVPKIGKVTLELSRTETTSRTAAAAALSLDVAVNPLDLNVAEVEGSVTLAEVSCRTPKAAKEVTTQTVPTEQPEEKPEEKAGEEADEEPAVRVEKEEPNGPNLAATGGDSRTPYLVGGAALLLGAGGGLVLARRRRS